VAFGSQATIVAEGDPKYVLVPDVNTVTTWPAVDFVTWPDVGFDTTGWTYWDGSPGGVGYDSGDGGYTPLIGVDLIEMDNVSTSAYIAYPFTFDGDPNGLTSLSLNIRYDDGFVAYLNGQEIHREMFDAGSTPAWNSTATGSHADTAALNLISFNVLDHKDAMNNGANLLAIHGLNDTATSSDLLISAELVGTLPGSFANLIAVHNDLRITEIMYNPAGSDDKEFIEFQNVGAATLDLTGVRLTDGVEFVFPAVTLAPGEYIVVARELAEFEDFYGAGINAIGDYVGSLSNAGEDILLQMPGMHEAAILRFDYNDAWYPATDGEGASLVIVNPLGRRGDWDPAAGWLPSGTAGGSPGTGDVTSDITLGSVVVNEVMAHTDGGVEDWIELHNTTEGDIDISGWFLSDDPSDLEKFVIPDNTILIAGGYVAFNEVTHFGTTVDPVNGFALSELGDTVIISSSDINGDISTYRSFVSFAATANGVSLGRHTLSTGEVDFVAMETPTYADENSAPLIGSMVIEEIMYNPDGPGGAEYILMKNISGSIVELYDPANPTNTWQISGGVEFVFPQGVTVQPGQFVLITNVDAATYLATRTVGADVQVFGPFTGALSNAGDTITVNRPGAPETTPVPLVPQIAVETIKFNDSLPWPEAADGDGPALAKLPGAIGEYGNDPINWGVSGGPAITINPLVTTDQTPELTGTVSDSHLLSTVTVTVNGVDYIVPIVGGTWTLADDAITAPLPGGVYDVAVSGFDIAGNLGADSTAGELNVDLGLGVVGRDVFYNNSAWDGAGDSAAIDTGKAALLPGQLPSSVNYTNYSRGINGIMVDIDGLTAAAPADFAIRISDAAGAWISGPEPTVNVLPGQGAGGSDRVALTWDDGAIVNRWIEVTVLATANTGLDSDDLFYFANATGDVDGDGDVDSADFSSLLGDFGQAGALGELTTDFNADGRTNLTDFVTLRSSYNNIVLTPSIAEAVPAAAPIAPAPVMAMAPVITEPIIEPESNSDPLVLAISEPMADLFVESQDVGEYIPVAAPEIQSESTLAATTESELRPLSDPEPDNNTDPLTDLLTEAALVLPL
jgi:hypothetical protein